MLLLLGSLERLLALLVDARELGARLGLAVERRLLLLAELLAVGDALLELLDLRERALELLDLLHGARRVKLLLDNKLGLGRARRRPRRRLGAPLLRLARLALGKLLRLELLGRQRRLADRADRLIAIQQTVEVSNRRSKSIQQRAIDVQSQFNTTQSN